MVDLVCYRFFLLFVFFFVRISAHQNLTPFPTRRSSYFRLSLLVFPKIRFKGGYPTAGEKKKKKEKRAGWSSHLVKAFWTAKKKKEKETKLLSPLEGNVNRTVYSLPPPPPTINHVWTVSTGAFRLSPPPHSSAPSLSFAQNKNQPLLTSKHTVISYTCRYK